MFHSIQLTYNRLIIFKNRFFINGKWGAFPVHSAGKRSYRQSKIGCFHTFTAPQTPTVQRIAVKDTSFTLLSHIRRGTSAKPVGQMLSGFLLILWKQIAGGLQAGFLAGATPLPAWTKVWKMREGSIFHSNLLGNSGVWHREGVKAAWGIPCCRVKEMGSMVSPRGCAKIDMTDYTFMK